MTHDDSGRRGAADEREDDLRATADSILTDLDRLRAVEDRKQTLPAGDPESDRLSSDAVRLADQLARKTRAERQLTDELD
jgi:hypothetical protein